MSFVHSCPTLRAIYQRSKDRICTCKVVQDKHVSGIKDYVRYVTLRCVAEDECSIERRADYNDADGGRLHKQSMLLLLCSSDSLLMVGVVPLSHLLDQWSQLLNHHVGRAAAFTQPTPRSEQPKIYNCSFSRTSAETLAAFCACAKRNLMLWGPISSVTTEQSMHEAALCHTCAERTAFLVNESCSKYTWSFSRL